MQSSFTSKCGRALSCAALGCKKQETLVCKSLTFVAFGPIPLTALPTLCCPTSPQQSTINARCNRRPDGGRARTHHHRPGGGTHALHDSPPRQLYALASGQKGGHLGGARDGTGDLGSVFGNQHVSRARELAQVPRSLNFSTKRILPLTTRVDANARTFHEILRAIAVSSARQNSIIVSRVQFLVFRPHRYVFNVRFSLLFFSTSAFFQNRSLFFPDFFALYCVALTIVPHQRKVRLPPGPRYDQRQLHPDLSAPRARVRMRGRLDGDQS